MKTDGDDVRADFAPLTGVAAGAEILDVDLVLDDERGAKMDIANANDAAQQGRRPRGTDDLALLAIGASHLHDVPARGIAEEFFCEGYAHSRQYAG